MNLFCPCTGININRTLITALAVFGFIFAFEFLFHGILLNDQYMATQSVWRPQEVMGDFMPYALLSQFLVALFATMLYAIFVNSAAFKQNLQFGIFLGLAKGAGMFSMYAYLPIPMDLALAWFAGSLLEGTGIGLVCGFIYKDTPKKACD